MLTGYKTYLVAAIAVLIGIDHGLISAHVAWFVANPIPDYVTWIFGALGLYSVRSAITTSTATATQNIVAQLAPVVVQNEARVAKPADSLSSAGVGNRAALQTGNMSQAVPTPDNLTFVRKTR